MNEQAAQGLNWIVLIGSPIVAGVIAVIRNSGTGDPVSAKSQALQMTLMFSFLLATVGGLVIDDLHPGFIPPSVAVLGIMQIPISVVVGLIAGRVCAMRVMHKQSDYTSWSPQEFDIDGECPECGAEIDTSKERCHECDLIL